MAGVDAQCGAGIEYARPIQVYFQAPAACKLPHGTGVLNGERRTAAAVVRVLQGDQAGDRLVGVIRTDPGLDIFQV